MALAEPNSALHPQSDPATFEHIVHLLSTRTQASPIYAFLLSSATIVHASKGLILAQITLTENHVNSSGSLHGGVSATLVDWGGGMAISSWDLRSKSGVSIDINITYLSGAKVGDVVEIEGKVDRVGGSIGFTSVNIWRLRDGLRTDKVVTGRHTKFVRGTAAPQ